ncbi:hypothetical protein ENBRE01_3501, partial [Enteropsectra breve]
MIFRDVISQILTGRFTPVPYTNPMARELSVKNEGKENEAAIFLLPDMLESTVLKDDIEKISGVPMPTMKLSKEYDLTMIMIIFEMRHKLFTTEHMKMTLAQCIEMLELYADLAFEPHATADIFVQDSKKQHAQVKLKCDLVFGLNLYHLLKRQELLKKFLEADNSALYKRLYFIEPLFRIVK